MRSFTKALRLATLTLVAAGLSGCPKQEPKPALPNAGDGLPPGHPTAGGDAAPVGSPRDPAALLPPGHTGKGALPVVVPDSVKGKWAAVLLLVKDKTNGTEQRVTVKVNGEAEIPGSTLKVAVGDLLPDFKITGGNATSVSAEPKNPAIKATISDRGRVLFDGWLYGRFPTVHPFDHERFAVFLDAGVPAK